MDREEWLRAVTSRLRPRFRRAGLPIPRVVILGVGLKSNKGRKAWRTVDAECLDTDPPRIYISTKLKNSMDVGGALVHELVHAAYKQDHNEGFFAACRKVGLEEGVPPNARACTEIGPRLRKSLAAIVNEIGDYPA